MDYRDFVNNEAGDLRSQLREAAEDWLRQETRLREKLLREGPDPNRVYTMEDIEALPEGIRAELVDGKLFFMESPTATHQEIEGELYLAVANHIRAKGGKCKVYLPPYSVFLNNNDSVCFQPDLTVVCDRSKLDERGCHGAPDWVVEITSPSTRKRDYGTKLFRYREAGVREYWIVDPARRVIMVYLFDRIPEDANVYSFEDTLSPSLYPDLKIRLADVV